MTSANPLILIIEDEAPIRRFLRASLAEEGYRFNEAETAREGLRLTVAQPPDLIILDLGLPDLGGLEVLKQIRDWSPVPIIIVSARGQERDKVLALDSGANDYLTKPFGVNELLARIRVALRLAAPASKSAEAVFSTGELKVDLAARRVWVRNEEIHLTPIGIPPAHYAHPRCRQSADANLPAQRSLGARPRAGKPLPASRHGQAPPQDRSRPGPATDNLHRDWSRLPPEC
jgi:CheY-like chemotaxis protein